MNTRIKTAPIKLKRESQPFMVRDCALIALATGKRARTMKELRDYLETIEPESIYYHFWGSLLRSRFEDPEYHNDFASWCAHSLNDQVAAERLAVVDPAQFQSLEDLRWELIDILDERIDELDVLPTTNQDKQFEFISSDIVVFATKRIINEPSELRQVIPGLSLGSIFYHFIDARRRNTDSLDDFRSWLLSFDSSYQNTMLGVAEIDPYFTNLTTLRDNLSEVFSKPMQGGV